MPTKLPLVGLVYKTRGRASCKVRCYGISGADAYPSSRHYLPVIAIHTLMSQISPPSTLSWAFIAARVRKFTIISKHAQISIRAYMYSMFLNLKILIMVLLQLRFTFRHR